MSKHFSPHRCITTPLLLLAALAGCGSTDGSRLLQPAGGYGGGGSGGSAGSAAGGAAGRGGSAGSAEPSDAGPDAASDASSTPSCVAGPLDQYCANGPGFCPTTYAEARAKSHETVLTLRPSLILQQACSAPDGSQRIRVSTVYYSGLLSRSYIFDPNGERLVSVQLVDDLGGCGDGSGSERGFYGEDLPGCSFDYSDFDVPPECNLPSNWAIPDAGTLDAGPDAGTAPYECILAP